MAEESAAVEKPFEAFELLVALLLGLAAIGAALAGIQAGQWGGKQLERFAEANAMTTKAAKSYNEAVSDLNSDYAVVGQAKRLIIEGIDADTDAQQERSYKLASYYLNEQLGEHAYNALKLPKETEAEAAADEEEADTEEEVEADLAKTLPEDVLIDVLQSELHDDDTYETAMFAEGTQLAEDAEAKFAAGQRANNYGDEFELAGLYYTIALFFAGLGLVFKTRMRWAFAGVGGLVFLISTVYLFTRTWPS